MRRLIATGRRLVSDERGVFLPLFGLLAIVLIATSGAVVDYTAMEQARSRAQVALDAASLALQPRIYSETTTVLKGKAQALVSERLADASITATVTDAAANTTDGSLTLTAEMTVPMLFVSLVGIDTLTARIVSEATRKQLNLEVAMVLDNSISMNQQSRMTNLKAAANSATEILFSNAETQPNVFVGVVPFTEFVNVGTSSRTASWMDQTGASKIARDNFDDNDYDGDTFSKPVNRFTLYSQLGVSWKGCVEARNHTQDSSGLFYDTSDSPPVSGVPDSLFVPVFAPDQPDSGSGYDNDYLSDTPNACTRKAPRYVWTQVKTRCDRSASSANNYNNANCSGTTSNTYEQYSELSVKSTVSSSRPASIFNNPDPGNNGYTDSYSSSGSGNRRTLTRTRTYTYEFSDRELQERLCKYSSGVKVSLTSNFQSGPNADCGVALQPLTNTKALVKSKINAMGPDGGTNIHQGVMWGFHMLSPTEPLAGSKDYDSATSKVMIVMTDGENTHSRHSNWVGANWYTAYGYPVNGRLTGNSTTALQTEMDNRTKTTCTNAKAAGIVIYTIGLSAPNQTTKDMLTDCATDPGKAYFPTEASQLTSVFEDIANQLSALRLAK